MPRTTSSTTNRSVSIRDVAELAGVSLGSASRVINKVENVTQATREKVTRAIAQLGYRPNHVAQSLRLRSTRTIGCMLTDVTNPLYGNLFHAIEERLRKAGYVVLLANSLNSAEREIDILATFVSRGMDGVLIAPGNERNAAVVKAVEALDIPTVILDRDMATHKDRVQFDHGPAMRSVMSYLIGLGHKRIALVVSEARSRPMRRRIEGFQAALRAHGLQADGDLIVQLPTSMSSAFSTVSQLLARPLRPTAIVAMGTNILNETLNAISSHRLRIPEDISVVSIGDPAFARSYVPPVSALHIDVDTVAEESATLLLDRIRHRDVSPRREVRVPFELLLRQSCGPAPGDVSR
jgi:LacI family transcriptional regulator